MKRPSVLLTVVALVGVAEPSASAGGVPPIPPPPIGFATEMVYEDECQITVWGPTTVKVGNRVVWANGDNDGPHTIFESAGLWTMALALDEEVEGYATAAGTFHQACDDGPASAWKVRLKAKARPADPEFTVRWALAGARAFWRFNVQYRIGGGSWRTWRPSTVSRSAVYDGRAGCRYGFRSRVINTNTRERTGWSPVRTVRT